MLRHAANAARRDGMGWNHCLCHGAFGAFELIDLALRHDVGPKGLTRESLRNELLASLDEVGPACGVVREAFVPGMLVGESGVAYQLLRMHPDSGLPSVLTLGEADLERAH
jgi:lantibiotic modifying enzyme